MFFKINKYAAKMVQVLHQYSLSEIRSANELHTLINTYIGPTNIPHEEYTGLAKALSSYSNSKDIKARALAAKDLVKEVSSHHLFPILTNDWHPFEQFIAVLSKLNVNDAVRFAQGLSAVAREVSSNDESQRILDGIEHFIPACKPDLQYTYYHSIANNLKDSGNYPAAENMYHKAIDAGKGHGFSLAGTLFQLGRIELELERDLKKAILLFDQALDAGFSQYGSNTSAWETYVHNSKIMALVALGEMENAHDTYRQVIENLDPVHINYPSEASIHHSMIGLTTHCAHGLLQEWQSRMSSIAMILSGAVREREATVIEVARALSSLLFPCEVSILLSFAKRDIEQLNMGMTEPYQRINLAHAYRCIGDYEQAIEHFILTAETTIERRDFSTAASALLQAALCEKIAGIGHYQQTISKATSLSHGLSNPRATSALQLGYKDTIVLLESCVNSLAIWPEVIEHPSKYSDKALAPLKSAIERRHTLFSEVDSVKMQPFKKIGLIKLMQDSVRLIGENGFLTFIKQQFGLTPREVILWAFSDITVTETQKRLLLESFINHTGMDANCRYNAPENGRKWVPALVELRGIFSRWLYESTFTNKAPDMSALKAFYQKWRKYDAVVDFKTRQNDLASSLKDQSKKEYDSDQYLNSTLFNHFNATTEATAVYIIHQVQKENALIWTVVKIGKDFQSTEYANMSVALSRKKAGAMVKEIQSYMQREEYGQLTNPHLINRYRTLLFVKLADLLTPLTKLLANVRRDARVCLKLAAPWNAIPFEQLPVFPNAEGLMDHFHLSRIDPFGQWVENILSTTADTVEKTAIVSAGFEGKGSAKLPVDNHYQMLCSKFGNLRKVSRFNELKKNLQPTAVLDFMGHGTLRDGLGTKEIFVMEFSDGDVLPQELVATSLSKCKLMVLNSCQLAMNPVDDEVVTEAVPNFTDHLLGVGVSSVVAALSVLNAHSIEGYMEKFYSAILQGEPLSQAAREGWGLQARMAQGRMLCPFTLFGKNIRFDFD